MGTKYNTIVSYVPESVASRMSTQQSLVQSLTWGGRLVDAFTDSSLATLDSLVSVHHTGFIFKAAGDTIKIVQINGQLVDNYILNGNSMALVSLVGV